MPTSTYTPLANLTLSSSAASVTFSSISQAYRDLVLIATTKGVSGGTQVIQFNSDSASNYSLVSAFGNGTSTFSSAATDVGVYTSGGLNTPSARFITHKYQIMDYSATNKHKSVLMRADDDGGGSGMTAARWANTAAITTIKFDMFGVNFASGSTFALYGIAA